jgi:hypothetical protein
MRFCSELLLGQCDVQMLSRLKPPLNEDFQFHGQTQQQIILSLSSHAHQRYATKLVFDQNAFLVLTSHVAV